MELQPVYNNLGIPVNLTVVAKLKERNPRWTVFTEWQLMEFEDAIAHHLQGFDIIPSFIDRENFDKYLTEFKSGQFKTKKGKSCDSQKRRTIDDSLIHSSNIVPLDVDKVSFNNTPDIIKQNAWIYYPSASITSVVDGDVAKMHFLYKMPNSIPQPYIKYYRQIFLELLCKPLNFEYDTAVVTARWEFYGKNPDFTDTNFIKRDDSKVIPIDLHLKIIEKVEQKILSEKAASFSDDKTLKYTLSKDDKTPLGERVDNYLIEKSSLEAIATLLFPSIDWQEKHHSLHTFEQWEAKADIFDPDANSDTGMALIHSDRTGRILICHKGTQRTLNLYEFYARYKLYVNGDNCWEKEVNLTGKNFKELVEEICTKLEIENFPFPDKKTPKKKNGELPDYDSFLPEYVKVYGDRTDKSTYYYYDYFLNIWTHTLSHETLIRRCLAPLITTYLETPFENCIKELMNLAKVVIKNKPCYGINKPLQGDPDLVGFTNGDYKISTKELLPFSPDNKVFERFSYPYSVIDTDINARVEACLKKWANQHETDWLVVRDWFYASFLKQGQKWCSGLFFYGTPGSGKSLMVQSLGLINEESNAVLQIKEENIISGKYPFSEYTPSCHAMFIDDVKDANTPGMNEFYSLLTENSKLQITAKYVNSMQVKRHSTFAFTSEDFPISLQSKRTGMIRRSLGVRVDHGIKGFAILKEEITSIFLNPEAMQEWFMWSLANVDTNALNERYRGFISDESRKKVVKQEISDASPVVEFANEELIVGGSEDDFVVKEQLIERYKSHAKKTNDTYSLKLHDLNMVKHILSNIVQGHENGQVMLDIQKRLKTSQGQPKQKRIDGRLKTVIWGLKFQDNDYQNGSQITEHQENGHKQQAELELDF